MLRHACGFALANKGHDTRALQAYLGHRNIQHTVKSTPSWRRPGSAISGDDHAAPILIEFETQRISVAVCEPLRMIQSIGIRVRQTERYRRLRDEAACLMIPTHDKPAAAAAAVLVKRKIEGRAASRQQDCHRNENQGAQDRPTASGMHLVQGEPLYWL
jgi:hypothetical protein